MSSIKDVSGLVDPPGTCPMICHCKDTPPYFGNVGFSAPGNTLLPHLWGMHAAYELPRSDRQPAVHRCKSGLRIRPFNGSRNTSEESQAGHIKKRSFLSKRTDNTFILEKKNSAFLTHFFVFCCCCFALRYVRHCASNI